MGGKISAGPFREDTPWMVEKVAAGHHPWWEYHVVTWFLWCYLQRKTPPILYIRRSLRRCARRSEEHKHWIFGVCISDPARENSSSHPQLLSRCTLHRI